MCCRRPFEELLRVDDFCISFRLCVNTPVRRQSLETKLEHMSVAVDSIKKQSMAESPFNGSRESISCDSSDNREYDAVKTSIATEPALVAALQHLEFTRALVNKAGFAFRLMKYHVALTVFSATLPNTLAELSWS